jgi:hypothetical protein
MVKNVTLLVQTTVTLFVYVILVINPTLINLAVEVPPTLHANILSLTSSVLQSHTVSSSDPLFL